MDPPKKRAREFFHRPLLQRRAILAVSAILAPLGYVGRYASSSNEASVAFTDAADEARGAGR
jgi:hypothetical protein